MFWIYKFGSYYQTIKTYFLLLKLVIRVEVFTIRLCWRECVSDHCVVRKMPLVASLFGQVISEDRT